MLDAYCGIGTIALFIVRHAREVIGLEVVLREVKDAQKNARHKCLVDMFSHTPHV